MCAVTVANIKTFALSTLCQLLENTFKTVERVLVQQSIGPFTFHTRKFEFCCVLAKYPELLCDASIRVNVRCLFSSSTYLTVFYSVLVVREVMVHVMISLSVTHSHHEVQLGQLRVQYLAQGPSTQTRETWTAGARD